MRMPAASYLVVRRFPSEKPLQTKLEFAASNGLFSGTAAIHCDAADLKKIGERLKDFPARARDEFRCEFGSEEPARHADQYFLLRAYTTDDSASHCALQFHMNGNTREPHEGKCTFSIKAEAAAINRLGSTFIAFARLEHLEFRWRLSGEELFEHDQSL